MNDRPTNRVSPGRTPVFAMPSLSCTMPRLGLRFRLTAANDNSPTAAGRGWLAFWWPVLAVLVLPPLITTIGVVIATM